MLYSEKEIEQIESILEEDKACILLDKLDGLINNSDLPSVSEMVNDALDSYKMKSMCVSRVDFMEKDAAVGKGYAIEIEKDNGYIIQSYYREENNCIPVSLLGTLLELSNLGYELKTYRKMRKLKLYMNGGIWNGSIS